MKCSVQDCDNDAFSRTWCRKHYMRWWTHGDVNKVLEKHALAGEPAAFLEKAKTYRGDECLIWPYATNGDGYGQINIGNGKKAVVSRLVCEDANGPAPSGTHQAAHSCGNGNSGCVTRLHLRWATPIQNQSDMIAHGRSQRGTKAFCNKLTEAQVIEVYRRVTDGENQYILASEFSIAQTAVSKIKRGKLWGWLTSQKGNGQCRTIS